MTYLVTDAEAVIQRRTYERREDPEGDLICDLLDTREALIEALRKAGVALVPALNHNLNSCNEGYPDKCFTCEAIGAIGPLLFQLKGEPAEVFR